MAISPIASAITFSILAITNIDVLVVAGPVLIAWAVAPIVEWWLGLPIPSKKTRITDAQQYYLRELARKTWAFFENLVGPTDNWLPPDNLQEYPIPVIAHRTSPTNIGLSLLSNLAAYDFGYATMEQFLQRTGDTLATMEKLDRYFGHFYNWYDTQTLRPLHPRYISTVDSGNLAGHLVTLRQGLLTLKSEKIIHPKLMDALHDTLRIAIASDPKEYPALLQFKRKFEENLDLSSWNLKEIRNQLEDLLLQLGNAADSLALDDRSELKQWLNTLSTEINKVLDEIDFLAPWLAMTIPDKFKSLKFLNNIPTLEQLAAADKELRLEWEELRVDATPAGDGLAYRACQRTRPCQQKSPRAHQPVGIAGCAMFRIR